MSGTHILAQTGTAAWMRALTPTQRGRVILEQARAELMRPLWQAALGDGPPDEQRAGCSCIVPDFSMAPQGALLLSDGAVPRPVGKAQIAAGTDPVPTPPKPEDAQPGKTHAPGDAGGLIDGLGRNAAYGAAILQAAGRTGIAPSALAAVIDAEAARNRDGSWNVMSRNPRSSAAGLGQFLSGTWLSMAQKPGTWLNTVANRNGWLSASGQVDAAHRAGLLRLRYDAEAAIESVADYAAENLAVMNRRGYTTGGDYASVARAIYLAHHLGPGDATLFLGRGLRAERAGMLLSAQIGRPEAARRIAIHGDAVSAHRQWLTGYIDARIRPDKYAATG